MELSTINSSLIGRKVSCSYGGFNRTGTIIALVDDEYTAGFNHFQIRPQNT